MIKKVASFKTVSFEWDITAGDSGAVGIYNTGVFLPQCSIQTEPILSIIKTLSGNPLAAIRIGNSVTASDFFPPTLLPLLNGATIRGNVPDLITDIRPCEIIFQISGADITEGRFIFSIPYYEMPNFIPT